MTDLSKLHVLLWSPSSNTLHRETLDKTVSVGLDCYFENRTKQDYIVLAVADSREALAELRNKIVETKEGVVDAEPEE